MFGRNAQYLKRKGVFFYDYLAGFEKFNEKNLPLKEAFYNKLTDQHISDSDYKYAKKIFKIFKMETLWDFTKLYMRVDTLLLAAIFENYRNVSLANYGLDSVHY